MVTIPLSSGDRKSNRSNRSSSPQGSNDVAKRSSGSRSQSPDDFLVLPFTLLVDHRERTGGWKFQGMKGDSVEKYRPLVVPQKECCLKTADYAIEGYPIFIERKSASDLIGSVGGGHSRLRAEHSRMKDIVDAGGKCFLIVEGSYSEIMDELSDPASTRGLHPSSLEGIVASWSAQFSVPWLFAGTRDYAEQLALKILRTWYDKLKGASE